MENISLSIFIVIIINIKQENHSGEKSFGKNRDNVN
jgi:hypothetical protein